MADNFFGFDSDFPRSNVLGRHGLDDVLLTDNVEEEIDALNDETFGRAANDDWEGAHEKLAELIKTNNLSGNSFFSDSQLDNDESQNEIVSKSISQLGLEDDLDDPAIMTISHSSSSSTRNLRSAFSSSPPPPAILETEVCGSPKTHSIWSTTPKDSGIASFLQSINRGSGSAPYPDTSTPLKSPLDDVFATPPKAWRAEELERDMLCSSKQETSHPPSSSWPQPLNQNASFPQNQNKVSGMLTREEVEKHMMTDPRMQFHPSQSRNMAPMIIPMQQTIMGIPRPNLNCSDQQPPVMPLRPPIRGPLIGNNCLPGANPFFLTRMNNIMHNQLQLRGPQLPNLPPGFNASNINLNHSKLLGLSPRNIGHPLMYKQFQFPMYVYNKQYANDDGQSNGQYYEDEYAGLMTQKEREWLIRIQLLQLKSEKPYFEDYYYTTQVARRCQKKYSETANKGSGDAPELILPETSKHENRAFVPVQFEGSLGKLQAVSFNFPRKVLDITSTTRSLEDEDGKTVSNQSLVKYRRLLLDIEKLFSYLLSIEDEERRILAKPDKESGRHRETIARLKENIYSGLFSDNSSLEKFQTILTIRKGRSFVMRVFNLFNTEQQLHCLLFLFRCLSVVLKKDQNDLILVHHIHMIADTIQKRSITDLVQMAEALNSDASLGSATAKGKYNNSFSYSLKNKFGSTVICTIIMQAENMYKSLGLFESDIQDRWTKIVLHLVDGLLTLPVSSVCPPLIPCLNLLSHFQRFFVDKEKIKDLKERVAVLETGTNIENVNV